MTSLHLRASGVALLYVLAAALWLWLSDFVLAKFLTDPARLAMWQNYKGWFFILISGLLLWSERAWSDWRVQQAEMQLQARMLESTSELERVREQLQIILDKAPVSFYMRDLEDHYLLVNDRWEEFMGVPASHALGKTPEDLFAPALAAETRQTINRVLQKKAGIVEEVPMHIDGRSYVFIRATFPLLDHEGKPYAVIGISTDISERKAVEESLRQAEERFRAIFQTVGMGIVLIDPGGRYVEANPAFQAMLGYDQAALIGKSYLEITHPPDLAASAKVFRHLAETPNASGEIEKRLVRADGALVWTRMLVSAIRNNEGALVLFVGVVEEITARKEAEAQRRRIQSELEGLVAERTAELQRANDHLSTILQASPSGIIALDVQGLVQIWNPAAEEIFGYSEQELTGRPVPEMGIPNDALYHEQRQRVLSGAGMVSYEAQRRRRDGSLVDVSISTAPLRDGKGVFFGTVALVRDISERKRASEALRASEERFSRIFYSSPYPTAYGGILDGVLLDVNDRFAQFFGVTREEMIGHNITEFGSWVNAEEGKTIFARLTRHGELLDYEVALRRKDGAARDVLMSLYRLNFGGRNEPDVTIGMFADITERKLAEAEVRRLNQELEARVVERTAHLEQEIAERTRAEAEVMELNSTLAKQAQHLVQVNQELETFTYSVSHDLKAPLRGIDGYSRLLLEDHADQLNDEGRHFLNTIRTATTQMARLIDDLLAYARLERRSMVVGQVNIRSLVESLLIQMQPEQVYPKTTIVVTLEDAKLNADTDGLALVLRNLMDNALKFSAECSNPRVEIGNVASGREEQKEGYCFFVRDNGVGFDMQYQERIFDIFQRLHRSEDYPGTGIGLAMVRKAVQRMHGRVWAESQPGEGATFYVEIPQP